MFVRNEVVFREFSEREIQVRSLQDEVGRLSGVMSGKMNGDSSGRWINLYWNLLILNLPFVIDSFYFLSSFV